jgi:hypothetical protein
MIVKDKWASYRAKRLTYNGMVGERGGKVTILLEETKKNKVVVGVKTEESALEKTVAIFCKKETKLHINQTLSLQENLLKLKYCIIRWSQFLLYPTHVMARRFCCRRPTSHIRHNQLTCYHRGNCKHF